MRIDPLLGMVLTSLFVLYGLVHGLARAWGRNCTPALFRYGEAEQKALALLKQWLSSAQLAQYERNGHFEVTGCHSGKRYRIQRAKQMNIEELDEHGAQIAVWCFGPEAELPACDVMLAQKIALETDERSALAVANRSR
jgi:hypothetical protein